MSFMLKDLLRAAAGKLRATEGRPGGSTQLTAGECEALLDALDLLTVEPVAIPSLEAECITEVRNICAGVGRAVRVHVPSRGKPVTLAERQEAARQEAEDAEEIYPEDLRR